MQFVFDFTLALTSSMLAATLGRLMQLMALHHSSSTPRHVPLLPLQLLRLRQSTGWPYYSCRLSNQMQFSALQ